MRLRYLHLQDLQPLDDLEIPFGYERVLGRDCAIRFVVGVNGSGKSSLLRAVASIFLALEARRLPSFPVTLAYDLGSGAEARTIVLHHPGLSASDARLIEFFPALHPSIGDWTWLEALSNTSTYTDLEVPYPIRSGPYRGDDLPGAGSINAYLPQVVLAYTSGATDAWTAIFTRDRAEIESVLSSTLEQAGRDMERPPKWDSRKETTYLRSIDDQAETRPSSSLPEAVLTSTDDLRTRSIGLYLPPDTLTVAFSAVALYQAGQDFRNLSTDQDEKTFIAQIERALLNEERMPGLRGLLNTVDWLWPVTLTLHVDLRPEHLTQRQSNDLARLYRCATSVVRESAIGTGRQLIFDLRRRLLDRVDSNMTTAAALIEAIAGRDEGDTTPITRFDLFSQLRSWQNEGLLDNVQMTIRKRGVHDVLHYNALSDGERMFLGRMALFQLLGGESDALVLLDEPETHFNDVWKREIVDIIDTSLGTKPSEIVITTHSSITLTDVFETEITLLRKDPSSGTVAAVKTPMQTFGASPTEIMVSIFGASETVGQRATEFLDLVLTVAAHPDPVQSVWSLDGNDEAVLSSAAFQQLSEFIDELPHTYGRGDDESRERYLLDALRSVRDYTQRQTGKTEITVIDALIELQERLGPGYYQFEFRRRLRSLRESSGNAPRD